MDVGIILIVSILVLGGAIATAGDRIGTRVGKARLSLFNLRPRQTAVLVTILTGISVSASTLAILFATSKSLRTGVFQLDQIQNKLKDARKELEETENQKKQIESELAKARGETAQAQTRLDATNESLRKTRAKQLSTEKQLQQIQSQLKKVSQQSTELRSEIQVILSERQELVKQRDQVKAEISQFKAKLAQRDQELAKQDRAINERDQKITQQDRKISERDRVIAQRETLLAQLEQQLEDREKQLADRVKQLKNQEQLLQDQEKQLAFLQQELVTLEQYYQSYQVLREGNVALLRGQILASGVLRIVEPTGARQAIDQLLTKANRAAIEATRLNNKDPNERVVQISQAQVEQLLNQIKDGRPYVIRIFSAGNYVVGEKQVEVFADSVVNQVVFSAGDVLAATSTDSSSIGEDEIRKRLEKLLAASQFRASRAGIIADRIQIGDNRIVTLIRFIEQIKQLREPVELQAVVPENIYTAGPLKIKLVAIKDGQVIFST